MKKFFTVFVLNIVLFISVNAQEGVELLGTLNPHGSEDYSDIWGYASNGREYALIGSETGTSIIDISDPTNPVEVTFITGPNSIWRDIKVNSHYAYIVTEGRSGNNGLQIVDLSDLPNTATLIKTTNEFFDSAHNIFIDDGYAYVIGTNDGGGMHILDLSDPENPVETAYYLGSDYIHDVYVWSDTVVACAEDTYDLVDVTDKSNPKKISSSAALPGIYAHSGWMTEDKRYFVAAEEANERDITVWDIQDRNNWKLVVGSLKLSDDTPVHNIFIRGNYAHISYYKEGYVVFDISKPEVPVPVGQYDTYEGNDGGFGGAWGCYPFLPSGNVIVSDILTGLYVFSFTPEENPAPFLAPILPPDIVLTGSDIELELNVADNGPITEAYLYYRTVINNNTGNWEVIKDSTVSNEIQFHFLLPSQSHQTIVEYYFAVTDESGKISTSPSGGSGNPPGAIPPSQFYSYITIFAHDPVIISLSPEFTDTTITTEQNLDFQVEAEDISDLELTYSWLLNGYMRSVTQNFSYRSKLGEVPRTDTLLLIIDNSFKSVEKTWIITVQEPTSINDPLNLIYDLQQNYPNPFNPSTTISYSIPEASNVRLKIFNSLGEIVITLVNKYQNRGKYEVSFNAEYLSSGLYVAQLITDNYSKNIKMLLVK